MSRQPKTAGQASADWKPWLRRVGAAALSGLSDEELRADPDGGFHLALNAIRAAHHARAGIAEDGPEDRP